MFVSEIFLSIQAEGLRFGRSSIFIRFATCNLRCKGFGVEYNNKLGCDTYYSVDLDFKDSWQRLNSKDIIKQVDNITKKLSYNPDIVITGGEPLLFWKNKDFQELLRYLSNNFFITIETNGTISIDLEKEYQKNILFSVSPKLSNAKESFNNFKTLDKLFYYKDNYLKFVVKDENDIKEIKEFKKKLKNIPNIYIMPLASSKKELENLSEKVINLAIKNGFLYTDRLHIRVWNKKKGK